MRPTLPILAALLGLLAPNAAGAAERTAVVAGGCFWCVESDFEKVPGVKDVVSGYTGGTLANPTYQNHEGHVEAARITYDDTVTDLPKLLHTFFRSVDPTDAGGQFCDRGHAYTTAVFVEGEEQKAQAEAAKAAAQDALGQPIVTPILPLGAFTVAEDYHQGYWKRNPVRYKYYRWNCGRDQRIKALWGERAHEGIVGHEG